MSPARVPTGWRRVAVVVSAALLLAGCGSGALDGIAAGSGDRDTGTSTSAAADTGAVTAEQEEWMSGLCTSLAAVADVAGTRRTAEGSDVRELPRVLAERVRKVERAVADLDAELTRLGPPPVERAGSVQDELRELVEKRRASLEKSATFVEDSDRGGAIGYVQTARAAQSAYTAGPVLVNDVSKVPELEEAFAATPACREADPGDDADATAGPR
ncbi:hypothetical protein EV383_5584 [Pseudonocardia sediminis]|uniref:Outer membrane protein n=1 Tax=Pseudonocardia sediminis TaxID=1397368 RepID=A0A4V2FRH7_PSEST|nr:hypothetical protein [Pseudonocardia sediminis]RZT88640.1 hypothetical protein EV383_5584 [Pseudonocardia sediminis]